jgi:hypothetical protein
MRHGEFNAETDDYEAFVAAGRRRFQRIVGGLTLLLLLCLHMPWALVSMHALSPGVAETMSCMSGLLLIAAWRALLTRLGDPNDGPEPTNESRGKHLAELLSASGGIIGAVVVLGAVSRVAGWIGTQGVIFTIGLTFLLVAAVGQTLFWRALRHGR